MHYGDRLLFPHALRTTFSTARSVLLWVVLLTMVLGCGRSQDSPDATPDNGSGYPRQVIDSAGFSVTLPARPIRIVSTAPSNTEILFAIGAGPQVVGVTTYCAYPAEAKSKEKVGGFAPNALSSERIIGLKPNLVLTTGRIQQSFTESLRKLGLNVLSYDASTLEEVVSNVRGLGQATGCEEEAEKLAKQMEHRIQQVRLRFTQLRMISRPAVLFLVSEEPLMIAGPKSFAGQMIVLAGGRNVFPEVKQQFPRISEEEILRSNPGAILLARHGEGEPPGAQLLKRPTWANMDAVRNKRVLIIDDDLINRPGPRLVDGLEILADLIHPKKK